MLGSACTLQSYLEFLSTTGANEPSPRAASMGNVCIARKKCEQKLLNAMGKFLAR
jgi:hypothetical protein